MSWLRESDQSWLVKLACRVLRAGPIPGHVAFIMDGNRRYARKAGLRNTTDGHSLGFDRLATTVEWCRDLGINEVTVYAFSIENFKRSKDEVDGLMDLARTKFQELLDDKEAMIRQGVKFQFFGNMTLLPIDIQELLAKISLFTWDFDKGRFNVCIAYTSQDEITRALKDIARGVDRGLIEPDDITEEMISGCLDTRGSPDPHLLIRTSGELRFSDFMLWQCSHSCVYFDDVLWPEFSFWNLSYAILHYQRHFSEIEALRQLRKSSEEDMNDSVKERQKNFLDTLNKEKE